jgi:heme-degrading monooxygenase HmoA
VILEHALLPVKSGSEPDFERAFTQAREIIAAMPGFRGLTLSRCLERPSTYLLLVEWDRLEDHTVGFRESPEYQQWRALLHSFYDPFPVVEHYARVLEEAP